MVNPFKLLVLPGDGMGPEVVAAGLCVFEEACQREAIETDVQHDLIHGAAREKYGSFCRDEILARAKQSQAVLIGAVGGPQWDDIHIEGAAPAERDGLMRLREELETCTRLQPARAYDALPWRQAGNLRALARHRTGPRRRRHYPADLRTDFKGTEARG